LLPREFPARVSEPARVRVPHPLEPALEFAPAREARWLVHPRAQRD
jgi:hypothetical protein